MITFYSRKVGGIRFFRVGRLQLSFCVVTKKAAPKRTLDNAYWDRRDRDQARAMQYADAIEAYWTKPGATLGW